MNTTGCNLTESISLSVVAPAYNESDGIRDTILRWHHFLFNSAIVEKFEIIICNDGSTDQTGEILADLAKKFPEIRPIHFANNQGAASALAAAISASQLDWVLLLDADDQFPIENLSLMHNVLQSRKVSAVIGIRNKQDHLFARVGTKLSGMVCNLIHLSKMKDFNSACKLVSGPILRSITLEAKGMNYSTEITSRLLEHRVPVAEVNIVHKARMQGKSSMRLLRGSTHRLLFVFYLALRQLLLKIDILKRTQL